MLYGNRSAEALKRCGVLSVVEYEVLLQGLIVLCSGLHSIVMLLYSAFIPNRGESFYLP